MNENDVKNRLEEMLPVGEEHAITAKEIKNLYGIDRRTLTAAIELARSNALLPIAANENGYYISATQDENDRFCRVFRHRIEAQSKSLAGCMKAGKSLPADGKEGI